MTAMIKQRDCEGWQQLPANWPDCLKRVMAARGIQQQEDLRFDLPDLPRPQQMLGMDEAVSLLYEALNKQWRVLIVADFDSDGASSCALAIRGLKAMGLNQVDFIVPNRFIHGYGLSPELVDEIDKAQQPDLIVTVDNGIAAISGVAAAQQRGIKVLVTDHHLAGDELPAAGAIINPNQPGDNFPSKNLAGVGVCFYLLLALRQYCREQHWFTQHGITEPKVIDWLDLVALGTVADVVVLDKLNRTLVDIGIQRMRQGQCCAGIKALAQVAGKDIRTVVSSDLGFSIAPRLNAAGRMEDMRIGIQLLTETDPQQALKTAAWLDEVNHERRAVEAQMQADALTMLEKELPAVHETSLGYCLYDEDWHQGVIGLLASRLKERFNRPVIVFAPGSEGELKGSARSIKGIHIRDVLAHIAAQHPDILQRFGGHAMAAGMTIRLQDLQAFQNSFQHSLSLLVDPQVFEKQRVSDGELMPNEFTLSTARMLTEAAPWGQGFDEPGFHGEFVVEQWRELGQDKSHLRLTVRAAQSDAVTAMAFRQQRPDWLDIGSKVLLRYRLAVNDFRNTQSLQLLVDELLPL